MVHRAHGLQPRISDLSVEDEEGDVRWPVAPNLIDLLMMNGDVDWRIQREGWKWRGRR